MKTIGNIICSICLFTLFGLLPFLSNAQDNTPPVITVPASNGTADCASITLIDELTLWFQNNGGAMATDNSGNFSFIGVPTLNQSLIIFENSQDTLCGSTRSVTVGFTAVDAAGNMSETTFASFSAIDNTPPIITKQPDDIFLECNGSARDSLISWIQEAGGAEASDDCSDSILWMSYVSNLPPFGTFSITDGPYPDLPTDRCNTNVNVTFFGEDECGNEVSVTGIFNIFDTQGPVFDSLPQEVTISCANLPDPASIKAFDACYGEVLVNVVDQNNRQGDSTSCNFYNYEILRTWTAVDLCGNRSAHSQIINVRDLEGPFIDFESPKVISCTQTATEDFLNYIDVFGDDCSEDVDLIVQDTRTQGSCNYSIVRLFTATDICGNETSVVQNLIVQDTMGPTLLTSAKDTLFNCGTSEDLQAIFEVWIDDFGGSSSLDDCNSIAIFAALPGSYNPLDPTTFPGTRPDSFRLTTCPSDIPGVKAYMEVDFLHIDLCDNVTVTKGLFGIRDVTPPTIGMCPPDRTFDISTNECTIEIEEVFPSGMDDCTATSNPLIVTVTEDVTSSEPGNPNILVNQVPIRIGPFNTNTFDILDTPTFEFILNNLDIDDDQEVFTIFNEDGNVIGTTPNASSQCGDATFQISTQSIDDVNRWLQDGFIEFLFAPTIPIGGNALGINSVCTASSITASAIIPIDPNETLFASYHINNEDEQSAEVNDTVNLELSLGANEIVYTLMDCAQNTTQCTQRITINDNVAPEVDCPIGFNVDLEADQCTYLFETQLNISVNENCGLPILYDNVQPPINEQNIIFRYDSINDRHIAIDRRYLFDNMVPIRYGDGARLVVTVNGDIDDFAESIEIIGENGIRLGFTNTINRPGCHMTSTTFDIPKAVFNLWTSDGNISITALMPRGNFEGGGINPCDQISAQDTIDNTSTLSMRLIFGDADIGISTSNNPDIVPFPNLFDTLRLVLVNGSNDITYFVTDQEGNTGSCTQTITVEDIQNPIARCNDAQLQVHPSGTISTAVLADDIDAGSSDNCGDINLQVLMDSVNCTNVGESITATLVVTDESGNRDECTSTISVVPYEILPTFQAGICDGDSLRLFANILLQDSIDYSVEWYKDGSLISNDLNPSFPNDADQSGVYEIRAESPNGCLSTGEVNVEFIPFTIPNINAEDTIVCANETVRLSTDAFTGNVVYSWYTGESPNGVLLGTSQDSFFDLTPTDSVNRFYVIAATPDCESPPSETLLLFGVDKPSVSIADDQITICEGEIFTLEPDEEEPNFEYSWLLPDGLMIDNFNTGVLVADLRQSGKTYKVIASLGDCISDTASVTINVLPRPSSPEITGDQLLCVGSTILLTTVINTNADSYEWYKNGLLNNVTDDNFLEIPNADVSMSGEWTVVAIINGCSSLPSPIFEITIDDLINVGATNSGPACEGDSITLTATFVPNATYEWSGPNFSANGQVVKALARSGDYVVTITTQALCINTASTEVDVISPPSITALSSDHPDCINPNTIITLTPTVFPIGNYQYSWTGPDGYNSTSDRAIINSPTLDSRGKYTLVVLNQGCPSNIAELDIDYNITPNDPIISGQSVVCEGESLNLTSNEIAETYKWITPNGIFNLSSNTFILQTTTQMNSGDYRLQLSNENCFSDTSSVFNVTVIPTPSAPIITGEQEYCFGSTIELFSNIPDASSYEWVTPSGIIAASDRLIIDDANPSMSGNYLLTYSIQGCTSEVSSPYVVVVRDSLKTPALIDTMLSVCSTLDSPVEICLSPQTLEPNAAYTLFNQTTNSGVSSTSSICFIIDDAQGFNPGTNELVIRGDVAGCSTPQSESYFILFQAPPSIIAQSEQDLIVACDGSEQVVLAALQGPPIVDVSWRALTPGVIINNPDAQSTISSGYVLGESLVELSYSQGGCNNFSRDTISVFVESPPETTNDLIAVPFNTSVQFDVTENDRSIPINSGIEIFYNGEGEIEIDDSSIEFIPQTGFVGVEEIVYEVCLEGCDDICSEAIVTLNIGLDQACELPTIFTPNQDGINDQLIVPCLGSGLYNQNSLVVFNEWGDEVYKASPYNNDWEGTYEGKALPVGTYYIVFDPGRGGTPLRGFLTLQR